MLLVLFILADAIFLTLSLLQLDLLLNRLLKLAYALRRIELSQWCTQLLALCL